jgi:uncharacterized protein (TIGR03382 family)
MLKKTLAWMGCLVAMALAAPAQAGGVIIDGWDADGTLSCNAACQERLSGDEDAGQEIYLLWSFVLNGHDAKAAETGDLDSDALNESDTADESEIDVDDPDAPLPSPILEEIEADAQGGCAAAPGGALAALAAVLLLRRRRR